MLIREGLQGKKKKGENTIFPCNIQEVAVKKMRSNKSHEFFAELKVLCKIHHINVVSDH